MSKTPPENPRDIFIDFLMAVHGLTKQGAKKETQKCIDEALAWFDTLYFTELNPKTMGSAGGKKRWKNISKEERSKIMTEVSHKRKKKKKE